MSAVPDAAWSATAPGGIEEVIVEAQRLSEPQEDYYDRLIAPWSLWNPQGGKGEHEAMAIVDLARRYDIRYENSAMIENDRSLIRLGLTTAGGGAAAAVGAAAFPVILANTGSVLQAGVTSGLLGTVAFQGYESVLSAGSGGTYGRSGLSTDEMLLGMALGPLTTPRQSLSELRGIKDVVANSERAVGGTSASGIQSLSKAPALEAGAIPKSIPTPYGEALQSNAIEALAARAQVEQGATLYRLGTLGKSEAAEAQFWSLENPTTPGYAGRYGLPPENVRNANFIETAVLKPGTPFVTRQAPAVGTNPGGGIEVVVPPSGVQLKLFSTH